jgi:hypothetical protein
MKSTKLMCLGILLMLLGVSLTSQLATALYVQNFGIQGYPPSLLVVISGLCMLGGLALGVIGFFQQK